MVNGNSPINTSLNRLIHPQVVPKCMHILHFRPLRSRLLIRIFQSSSFQSPKRAVTVRTLLQKAGELTSANGQDVRRLRKENSSNLKTMPGCMSTNISVQRNYLSVLSHRGTYYQYFRSQPYSYFMVAENNSRPRTLLNVIGIRRIAKHIRVPFGT